MGTHPPITGVESEPTRILPLLDERFFKVQTNAHPPNGRKGEQKGVRLPIPGRAQQPNRMPAF
jgi:hypothetical protein